MKSLTKFRKGSFWILGLIAILLAVAQPAKAYQDPRLVGDKFGWSYKDNANAVVLGINGGETKVFTISNWQGGNFKISAPYDDWSGEHYFSTSSATTFSNGQTVSLSEGGDDNNLSLPAAANGKDIKLQLTVDNGKKPTSLKISWSTVTEAEDGFYIAGGFLGNWAKDQRVAFVPNADNAKVLTATVRYGEANANNKGFKITTKRTADDGTWYSIGGSRMAKDVEYDIASKTESANMLLATSALNKNVTFTLTLGNDNKPSKLKAQWEGEDVDPTSDMPVYPVGVYTEEALKRYDKWPVLYLKARVLNNERITPEYQMTQIDANTYELEFTARNSNTEDEQWSTWDQKYWVQGFEDAISPAKQFTDYQSLTIPKTNAKEGARYKAVCKKGTDGKWTLTLSPVGDVNNMPFISMIGESWKQRSNAVTPYVRNGANTKKTNDGWQEAWVQYDNRGQVLLDRNGKVMYNTMWPPKNPILFKTEFNLNGSSKDFTLSSKDLALKFVGTKTGAEWKADPLFADFKTRNENLGDKNNLRVHENMLALDNDRTYTLYQVDDMWINGRVKIWSGWGGVTGQKDNDNSAANWSWHTNWGHFGESNDATGIQPESSVPLSNRNGDVIFDKPTFFKHVSLFYDATDGGNMANTKGYSVFFTERAFGGAQIAALSTNDYTVGNYQASLSNIDSSVKDGKLKKVVIRSYMTNSDGENETEELVANVFNWTASDEAVSVPDFYTLFTDQLSNDELPGAGGFVDPASTGKWVKDKTKYPNGDYFYRMTVILTDTNDEEHTVIVDSNPFTIFRAQEELDLNVYQLVKIGDKIENGVRVGKYYTFKGDVKNPTVPLLPVYELTIKNDDKFDATSDNPNFRYDEDGNMIGGYIDDTNYEFTYKTLDEIPDYSAQDLSFTDKILIVGSVPSATSVEGYKYGATSVEGQITPPEVTETENPEESHAFIGGPVKAPMTEEFDQNCQRPEYGDRFMHVTNVGSFNKREFSLQMQYSTSFLDAEGELHKIENAVTPAATTQYYAIVPEPVLKEAKVQVFYGDDATEDTDKQIDEFEFRGLKFKGHYTSVRDYISIDFPNVSSYLQKRMEIRNFFSIIMNNDNIDGYDDEQWENVFTFGDDNDEEAGIVVGDFMHPQKFSQTRTIELKKEEKDADGNDLYYYPRWEDQDLTPLSISDNAPIEWAHQIYYNKDNKDDELNPKVYVDKDLNLIKRITVQMQHKADYVPNPTNEDNIEAAKKDKHNYIFHEGKDDLFELLPHNCEHHFYYVALIDTKLSNNETEGDEDDIIDKNGNRATTDEAKLHYVVSKPDLMNGNYKTVTILKYYGKVPAYEDETWDDVLTREAMIENARNDEFYKSYRVYVSYLYPFKGGDNILPQTPEQTDGPQRAVRDYSGPVLKSKAAVGTLAIPEDMGVITEVDNIEADYGYVNTGAGYIEVAGANVSIINAAGVVVGEGAGHFDVTPGVYVVRYNGKTVKVVVR